MDSFVDFNSASEDQIKVIDQIIKDYASKMQIDATVWRMDEPTSYISQSNPNDPNVLRMVQISIFADENRKIAVDFIPSSQTIEPWNPKDQIPQSCIVRVYLPPTQKSARKNKKAMLLFVNELNDAIEQSWHNALSMSPY